MMLLIAATTMNAQTIVKGDMNNDNELTITDAVSVVDVILGKSPMQVIDLGDPYLVDNKRVIGTWYAPDGTSFAFNEDGTTTYPGGATYEFMPLLGRLLIFNAQEHPVKVLPLLKVKAEYLLAVDYATGVFTYYTNQASLATGITLDQSSLTMNTGTTAQLTATILPETAFASVSWTSSNENVATVDPNGTITAVARGTCTITATVSGSMQTAVCTVTVKQMVTSITLSQTSVIMDMDTYVRLTATVLPENADNKDVVWSSSNENIAPVKNGRVDAYGSGSAVITCEAADGSGVKATCEIFIVDPSSYVDLGLPSGTLWATCNVGATNPEDYGDYFAWGETTGYYDGKNNFDWSTYQWCKGSETTMTKYCTISNYGYEGFTDNKTELDLEDDAAYVNCGPAWRMPSKEQFDELINSSNTSIEWITQNNVNGRKITSNKNGKSIFLPAAGDYYNSSIINAVSNGYYWSCTLAGSRHDYAMYLIFGSSNCYTVGSNRASGRSVRPVRLTK